ncbi:hypothetical protein HPB51_023538 [Rhipicephalus microplus]|uniref:Uncharacterized protein n=1 Tax=Rhipicephalus microplus TaxID=6941 RepID=A0A9J6F6E1_RHIMP|nr:hypothetical protein HPB51_023538 [Rhipicephalus microplus]
MDDMELEKLIEQGKAFGFVGKQLHNFVEKERNRLKEERNAERTWYMQTMQLEMEREKERSRLRIEEAKERLKLEPLTTQSDPCSGSGISNSATVHAPNRLAQSYHEYVEKLRLKIQSRRREFEAFDVMHKRCKEPECVEPLKAGQAGSTWEVDSRFIPEPNVLAVESPFVAKVANESWRNGDEELCRQGSNGIEKPSAGYSPQPPCMFVSMAADTEVRSPTRSAGESPCKYSGSEPCAEVRCRLDSTIVHSSFRLEVNNADLRKINDEIETCLAEDAFEEELEESIQYNDKANQTIGLLKAKTVLASAITPSSSETSHLLPSQTHHYGVKLPKLHLKLFGRELSAWQAF